MSDSKFSSGVAFLTMLKFAYFWHFGVHLGSHRGPLRDRTLQNMTFGMSFDSLMTIARKRNGSKKSQSLGSDIKRHITLKVVKKYPQTAKSVFAGSYSHWLLSMENIFDQE